MRIGCLQFDPRLGEVDNNLNCADDILDGVKPEDLDGLDLLVLPELAFTGYNFRSLQHIAPCLEEAGRGITSLWAQTTALKYDCAVVAGYPEKVDVSANWPASPEYYNSAFIVNGDGDKVGNYRKSFLYYTDETWALEGTNGFFKGEIPRLGNVALGICTDLNPYKLEAPWDAFEFGFHITKTQADVVILSMAWQTHQDADSFNLTPAEPDLETLTYWVQRLEPVIRANKEEEVVVVFCNRTGAEYGVTYTGTSAVLGIKGGQVFVYDVLGRGESGLLVVDTEIAPKCKLTDADAVVADEPVSQPPKTPLEVKPAKPATRLTCQIPDSSLWDEHDHENCPCDLGNTGPSQALSSPRQPTSPRQPNSPRLPWLAQPTSPGTPTDSRSPTRLQIPTPSRPQFEEFTAIDSAITDDIIIDTPGGSALPGTPAFARRLLNRPKLGVPTAAGTSNTPSSPWRFHNDTRSPYPWHHHEGSQSSVFGAGATMTPITPFDEDGWSSTPIEQKAAPSWFWRHEPKLAALKESIIEEEEEEDEEEKKDGKEQEKKQEVNIPEKKEESMKDVEMKQMVERKRVSAPSEEVAFFLAEGSQTGSDTEVEAKGFDKEEESEETEPADNDWASLTNVLQGLKVRPGSVFDLKSSSERPSSPKSRNMSRSSSPFQIFQPSELGYGEEEQTAWGLPSKVSPRLNQQSNSFEGPGRIIGGEGRGERRRRPSGLRHATSFAEEHGSEPGNDSEPEYDARSRRGKMKPATYQPPVFQHQPDLPSADDNHATTLSTTPQPNLPENNNNNNDNDNHSALPSPSFTSYPLTSPKPPSSTKRKPPSPLYLISPTNTAVPAGPLTAALVTSGISVSTLTTPALTTAGLSSATSATSSSMSSALSATSATSGPSVLSVRSGFGQYWDGDEYYATGGGGGGSVDEYAAGEYEEYRDYQKWTGSWEAGEKGVKGSGGGSGVVDKGKGVDRYWNKN